MTKFKTSRWGVERTFSECARSQIETYRGGWRSNEERRKKNANIYTQKKNPKCKGAFNTTLGRRLDQKYPQNVVYMDKENRAFTSRQQENQSKRRHIGMKFAESSAGDNVKKNPRKEAHGLKNVKNKEYQGRGPVPRCISPRIAPWKRFHPRDGISIPRYYPSEC